MSANDYYDIRSIQPKDNLTIAQIIREVMPEFGASGAGFAIHDPEIDDMYTAYRAPRCTYYIVADGIKLLGGGGISPLQGGDVKICELQKMYLLPEARGLGLGQRLLSLCIEDSKKFGYRDCYVETLKTMEAAQTLYLTNGFKPLIKPLGQTGHFGCDAWFIRALQNEKCI